jgi:NADPH2:quinone reductase
VAHRTAYHALRSVARIDEGDWVVVLGAGGGVGLATVELARILGARVLAAASGPEKLAAAREKGAEALVDYSTEDLKDRVKELCGGAADVVVDPVGGPYAEAALRALRWGGRFVSVGFASGEIPRIPLNLVLLKGVFVTGFTMEGLGRNQAADARYPRPDGAGTVGHVRSEGGRQDPGRAGSGLRHSEPDGVATPP